MEGAIESSEGCSKATHHRNAAHHGAADSIRRFGSSGLRVAAARFSSYVSISWRPQSLECAMIRDEHTKRHSSAVPHA